jgi:RNA recognition motif-containing protein
VFSLITLLTLCSLQRNLDASSLTKDEMIGLLEKADAISAKSEAVSEEGVQASEAVAAPAPATADSNDQEPASSGAAAPPPGHVDASTGEPIRTLYVGNCPASLSERELYQVFNRFVGFESSYLYHMNGKVSGFVTFSSSEYATYAVAFCKQHGGFPLDPFLILVLDVQLANQNSNRKRRADQYYPAEVGYAYSSARPSSASDGYGYGAASSYYAGYGAAAVASSSASGYENYTQVADLASAAAYSSGKSSSRMPPSATLFISYITDETTVEDLRAVFGQMVGFRAARKTTMRGAPCAFIEFDNDRNSTVAMNIMQGQCLRPTDRGGLRIEYAKPTLNPTKTPSTVPAPMNTGAYAGSYGGAPGRW